MPSRTSESGLAGEVIQSSWNNERTSEVLSSFVLDRLGRLGEVSLDLAEVDLET